MDSAAGQSCVLCGADCGTTVPAHLPGSIYRMPAGVGQRTHDWLVGHLCFDCHQWIDGPEGRRDVTMRMAALCLTLERLFDEGVLVVAKR